MQWDDLLLLFPQLDDPGRWLPILQRHLALVTASADRTRVTSVPPEEAVQRHYAECLELTRVAWETATPESVIDVGAGGGYPGMVIAAVAPQTRVTLVEPLKKRARLLEEMAAELGLHNVRVEPVRAEEAGRGPLRESADLVTARAVAPLAELLEYTAPLAAVGGRVILPKGNALPSELEEGAVAIALLGCRLRETIPARAEVAETLVFAAFEKVGSTPPQYPRRPGLPGKRPLK